MSRSMGAYQESGVQDMGAYPFAASGPSIPAGTTEGFIAGGAITSDSGRRVVVVSKDTAAVAGDVYIAGVRYSSDGLMYVTTDAPPGTADVTIKSILHTSTGERYVQTGDTTLKGPNAMARNSSAQLAYMTDELTIVGYSRAFGVDIDGAVLFRT